MKPSPNTSVSGETAHSLDVLGLIALGASLSQPQVAAENGIPFMTVMTSQEETKQVPLEHFLSRPSIVRAAVQVRDTESFIGYIQKYRTTDQQLAIFAAISETGAEFTAILDYHELYSNRPSWGVNRCVFTCTETPEWVRWKSMNKQAMSQADFARFIEDNAPDFVTPSSAAMQEMALTLEARTTGEFANAVRLQTGTYSLRYSENVEAKAGANGDQEIPAMFEIAIAPFVGFAPWKIQARLRFKLSGGKLTFTYELVRVHKLIEAAAKEIIDKITQGTVIVPFRGAVLGMGAK